MRSSSFSLALRCSFRSFVVVKIEVVGEVIRVAICCRVWNVALISKFFCLRVCALL